MKTLDNLSDDWEHDVDNDYIRFFKDGKEIHLVEVSEVVNAYARAIPEKQIR